jgi:isocitrate dehydrogenase
MATTTPVTVARGDGIGPEIMDATLRLIQADGTGLDIQTIEIGDKVYLSGNSADVRMESLRNFDGQSGYSLGQGR